MGLIFTETSMPIRIATTVASFDLPRRLLSQVARQVLKGENRTGETVTIIVVDDPYIRRLNRTYRNLDRATDVLSFGLADEQISSDFLLGELYVSLDRAREQAARFQVSLEEELRRLVVHGCLHLLGYDHHRARDRVIMRAKEAVYLTPRSIQENRS